jgi:hypothetical protein
MTLKQSSAVHIQALVSADGILPGFCWLTSAFNYKFSFGSGRTVGQFPNCTKPCPLAARQRRNFFLTKNQCGSSFCFIKFFVRQIPLLLAAIKNGSGFCFAFGLDGVSLFLFQFRTPWTK